MSSATNESASATPPPATLAARPRGRISPLLGWLLWLLAAIWAALALFYFWIPAFPLLYLGRAGLGAGAAILGAAGWVARRLPAPLSLAAAAAAYAGTAAYSYLGPGQGWTMPLVQHPRYGHVSAPAPPGESWYQWCHPDFLVHYTIDAEGFRSTPPPPGPSRGTIAILGCSYAFGIGVEDNEVYAAILAREDWPNYRVLNRAFPGWGTSESLVVLEDLLETPERPVAVIYGWIDNHERRNWLRKSWHQNKLPWGGVMQRFELVDGQLQRLGLADPRLATADDSPATTAVEEPLTLALVMRMVESCRAHDTEFFLVACNQYYDGTSRVPDLVAAQGVPVIDVRNVPRDYFTIDTHPAAAWHRNVARRIADDPRLARFRKP